MEDIINQIKNLDPKAIANQKEHERKEWLKSRRDETDQPRKKRRVFSLSAGDSYQAWDSSVTAMTNTLPRSASVGLERTDTQHNKE